MHNFIANKQFENEVVSLLKRYNVTDDNISYQLYTTVHKQAFLAVMYSLTGHITKSAIMHDTDKLYLYGRMSKDKASILHNKYAIHHIENRNTDVNKLDCVIDYECARFTKPDKPLNAYCTIMKYRPHAYDMLKDTLTELGLNSAENIDIDFNNWTIVSDRILEKCLSDIEKQFKLMAEEEKNSSIENAERRFYVTDHNEILLI